MSDITKSVLLKIDIDNADGERRLAEIRDEINKLQESQKNNTRATQEQKDAYEKSAVAIKSLQQEQRNLQGVMVAQNNAAKANKGSFQELYNQWKAAEAQLKNLSGTIQKNEDGTMSLTQEYKDQAAQVDKLKQTLLLFNAGIAQGNLNVGNYGNTLDGMRQKLKDLGVIIQTTDVGTEEFRKAKEEAEKLSTEIQIAEGKIDSMGNKVAKNSIKDTFNDITGATQALSGALGVAMLAAGDNEEAQERLRKAMGAVAIAQTALTLARQKDDILQTAQLVKTKALTAAQTAYSFVLKGATAAQKAFNATLVGAAVTGIVLAITKIVDAMKKQKDATQDAIEKQEEWKQQQADETEKQVAKLLQLESQILRVSDRVKNIRKGEAEGKDMTEARISLAEDEVEALKNLIAFENERSEKYKQVSEIIFEKEIELSQLQTKRREKEKENANNSIQDNKQVADSLQLIIDANAEVLKQNRDAAWEYYHALNAAIAQTVSDSKKQFDAMGEEIVEGADNVGDLIFASFTKNRNIQKTESEEMMDQWLQYATATADSLSNVLGNSIGGAYESVKDFQKDLLKVSLTALKNAFQLALAQGAFKEITSKGVAGVLTAAITTVAIETAYSAALAGIEGFATGGKIKGGQPIQRSNGDDVLITAKKGEVILNNGQQRRLERMGGKDIWNRLGVPGFADGGFVPRQISGEAAMNVSMSAMRELQDAFRSMPAPVLTYKEFATFERSVQYADKVGGL